MNYQILLYYKYVSIENPEELRDAQRDLCERLNLKGRIIVASEGINGTVEGTVEATEEYIATLITDSRFKDIHWKKSPGTGDAFPKLKVKARSEIVSSHLGEKDIDPTKTTGKRLSPAQLNAWFKEGKEFYIVDMRNDYEHVSGHFEGSILPELRNFRDLSAILPELEHIKGKTILTVCTGGVRCEKASGFLVANGFADVYQLDGGIVSYMEQYPNQDFKGKLYVFDGRVLMGFNTDNPEHTVIGTCELCGCSCERYINCLNIACHRHFICCESCSKGTDSVPCTQECADICRSKLLQPA